MMLHFCRRKLKFHFLHDGGIIAAQIWTKQFQFLGPNSQIIKIKPFYWNGHKKRFDTLMGGSNPPSPFLPFQTKSQVPLYLFQVPLYFSQVPLYFFQVPLYFSSSRLGKPSCKKNGQKSGQCPYGVYPSSLILASFYQALKSLGNGLSTLTNWPQNVMFVCILESRVA